MSTTSKRPLWVDIFLKALAKNGNITVSAEAAGVDRKTVYNWRDGDTDFAAEWEDALESSRDLAELELRRRAVHGVDEPVIWQGNLAGSYEDALTGQPCKWTDPGAIFQPLTVKKYSDVLLIFHLKGERPAKFRDNSTVSHVGPDGRSPVQFVLDVPGLVAPVLPPIPVESREVPALPAPASLSPAVLPSIVEPDDTPPPT